MNSSDQIKLLAKAYQFASIKHQDQRRKYGDIPYINHPIQVCRVLTECDITNVEILCAAVLHDTIEDTGTTAEEIQKQFGSKVRQYVFDCTDDKSLSKIQRKQAQVDHAKHITKQGQFVKIADKISNCKSVIQTPPPNWSEQIKFGYLVWAEAVFQSAKGQNYKLNKMLIQILQKGGVYKIDAKQREKVLGQYYERLKK